MSDEANGRELLRFAITFIMSWKIWSDVTLVLSWFESDDVWTRVQILFEIACLLGYEAFDTDRVPQLTCLGLQPT